MAGAQQLTPGIVNRRGAAASRPSASSVAAGTTFLATDTLVLSESDGASWVSVASGGGGGSVGAGSITNTEVSASAAISESKLSLASDAAAGVASRRSLGTSSSQAASGSDTRFSDARAPLDASVTSAKIAAGGISAASVTGTAIVSSDARLSDTRASAPASVTDASVAANAAIAESKLALASDAAAATASRRTLGTSATSAAAGNDARLSDARTPSDASVTDAKITTTLSPSKITGVAVVTADARLSDARAPSGSAGGDLTGSFPSPTLAAAGPGATTSGDATHTSTLTIDAKGRVTALAPNAIPSDAAVGTASMRTLGTGALQAAAGDDSRFGGASAVPIGTDVLDANAGLVQHTAAGVVTGGLLPVFYPIMPEGLSSYALSAMRARVRTLLAASTIGMAVYSIAYTANATFTAALVAQLTTPPSGGATGIVTADVTSGPITLNFLTTRYVVAIITSSNVTLALAATSATTAGSVGALKWNTTARASTTDWPATFANTDVIGVASGIGVPWVALVTANGKWWM